MSERHASGNVLAWTIPPSVDPERVCSREGPDLEIRKLADELEVVCQPEGIDLTLFPPGISRIHLRFADREAAFRALDAANATVRAHPGVACRIVATTEDPAD